MGLGEEEMTQRKCSENSPWASSLQPHEGMPCPRVCLSFIILHARIHIGSLLRGQTELLLWTLLVALDCLLLWALSGGGHSWASASRWSWSPGTLSLECVFQGHSWALGGTWSQCTPDLLSEPHLQLRKERCSSPGPAWWSQTSLRMDEMSML